MLTHKHTPTHAHTQTYTPSAARALVPVASYPRVSSPTPAPTTNTYRHMCSTRAHTCTRTYLFLLRGFVFESLELLEFLLQRLDALFFSASALILTQLHLTLDLSLAE